MKALAFGVALAAIGAPSWLALALGIALALSGRVRPPPELSTWTSRVLQAGVVTLGAGMNLDTVVRAGASGALWTAAVLAIALALARVLGRALRVEADTSLLVGVGTAICGGSAIAAVAGVIQPKAHETSVALGVVFVLNAVALLIFPPIGHALGMPAEEFGRWAALAIHDTSSVVGAALSFDPGSVEIATTTKLARALWIVPLSGAIALLRRKGSLKKVKIPYFIGGFLAFAALFTWVAPLAPAAPYVSGLGKRLLVLALFLVGLGLSRDNLKQVGPRALALGVLLWAAMASISLFLVQSSG